MDKYINWTVGDDMQVLTLLGLGVQSINRIPLSFSLSIHFQLTFTLTSTFRVQVGLNLTYVCVQAHRGGSGCLDIHCLLF